MFFPLFVFIFDEKGFFRKISKLFNYKNIPKKYLTKNEGIIN